jgi:23S rRNA (cytosine1962-C5)-methyltransferase
LVVQVRSMGMERMKPLWLPALIETTRPKSVFERSEMAGREEEGLGPMAGQLHGETPHEVEIEETGLRYLVSATGGLKTGFYLDQRATRRELERRVKPGQRVLDAFCYRRTAELNGATCEFEQANVFDWLEREPGELFDWIVIDPPAISKTAASRDSLKWAVWKLVHRGVPHLKSGGRMIVCSCSYQLDRKELVETARLAASDRSVRMYLEDVTLQDLDHPAPIQFPESLYLKCAWLRLERD